MAFDNLHHIVLGRHILRYIGINHLALRLTAIQSLLHHARAHRCHLWTMVGVNNRGHDITTKGRTNLIEQVSIVLTRFLFVVVTNLELRAIGR